MNFDKDMKQKVAEIEVIITSYLPCAEGFQKTLIEAIHYSMQAGGKRIRPLLMQESYQLFGGEEEVIKPFMAALEMIHTHSLIHDDLPAIDNDDYRRGRQATHVVFGEALGVLSGDALLNLAYETVAKAFELGADTTRVGRAIGILANKTGSHGMLGGQCIDVEAVGQSISIDKLKTVYRLKTAALLESAMMIGAILAGAADEEVEKMRQIGEAIGLAFQIRDDLLDVLGNEQMLGKPIGSDEENEKTTYVCLRGTEQAIADVEEISNRAIQILDSFDQQNEFLRTLVIQMINREK